VIREDRTRSLHRAELEARRIGKVLTKELTAELDLTTAAAFRDAQEKVPTKSRSLKNSGRSGSDVRDDGETWIGYMAWGGPSAPHDVDYAIYVMANGGESDWLRESHAYDAALEAVINLHLRKNLG